MLKENIQPIENATQIITQLQPKTFNFKTNDFPMNLADGVQYGLIAQDVEQVLPEINSNTAYPAQFDSLGNKISEEVQYLSTNYQALIPILIQGMKEQQQMISDLQDEVALLGGGSNKMGSGGSDEDNSSNSNGSNSLNQNYPNPFMQATNISYQLQNAGDVELNIYNQQTGAHVSTLFNGFQDAGEYDINWSTQNIPSGVYIYSLQVDGKVLTKKAIHVK